MKRRLWSEKEIEYLENAVGRITVPAMAKHLKRTETAVLVKMGRLGINNTKLETGMITLHELSKACNVNPNVVMGWIRDGLTAKSKITKSKAKFNFIDIEEFWEWAAANKSRIDFYKVDKHVLLPEPDWLEFERKHDYHHMPRKQHKLWTKEEDSKMRQLVRIGTSYADIGKELNRSARAVSKRLTKLRNRRGVS